MKVIKLSVSENVNQSPAGFIGKQNMHKES